MSAQDILTRIIEYKREEVEKQKHDLPIERLKEAVAGMSETLSLVRKFHEAIVRGQMALIAEIKKASPSKGLIREDFDPVEIAKIYQKCEASAISVLTDEKFFQGSLAYLDQVVRTVKIPVLRKDFIIDEYQIYQSRYFGADVILLISSVLSKQQLSDYQNIAHNLGLECLVETHSEEDFDFHLENKTPIIGINNRNLKTFETDINHTISLLKDKKTCKSFVVSESGIYTFKDILALSNAGVTAVLVGECFMREYDISMAVKKLFAKS